MNIDVSTLMEICDGLLIPDQEMLNIRILNAAKRGIAWGHKNPDPSALIAHRARLCLSIMRRFDCTALDACIAMELSREERKPVLKVVEARQRQKAGK